MNHNSLPLKTFQEVETSREKINIKILIFIVQTRRKFKHTCAYYQLSWKKLLRVIIIYEPLKSLYGMCNNTNNDIAELSLALKDQAILLASESEMSVDLVQEKKRKSSGQPTIAQPTQKKTNLERVPTKLEPVFRKLRTLDDKTLRNELHIRYLNEYLMQCLTGNPDEDNKSQIRLNRELYWIVELCSLSPYGLNVKLGRPFSS